MSIRHAENRRFLPCGRITGKLPAGQKSFKNPHKYAFRFTALTLNSSFLCSLKLQKQMRPYQGNILPKLSPVRVWRSAPLMPARRLAGAACSGRTQMSPACGPSGRKRRAGISGAQSPYDVHKSNLPRIEYKPGRAACGSRPAPRQSIYIFSLFAIEISKCR